jgi:hypothetical protein
MKIDCDSCAVKDIACGDCVVNLFLSLPAPEMDSDHNESELAVREDLTAAETKALAVMARSGLIPHLRLVELRQRNAG